MFQNETLCSNFSNIRFSRNGSQPPTLLFCYLAVNQRKVGGMVVVGKAAERPEFLRLAVN